MSYPPAASHPQFGRPGPLRCLLKRRPAQMLPSSAERRLRTGLPRPSIRVRFSLYDSAIVDPQLCCARSRVYRLQQAHIRSFCNSKNAVNISRLANTRYSDGFILAEQLRSCRRPALVHSKTRLQPGLGRDRHTWPCDVGHAHLRRRFRPLPASFSRT